MSFSAWGSDSVPAITLPISQPIINTPIATPIVHHARRLVLALALLLPTTVITTAAPAQPSALLPSGSWRPRLPSQPC